MASAVRSVFYHPGQPLALHTDASNTAIGPALSQRHANDDWPPLGFFSQKLSPTQQRYSMYDRELLIHSPSVLYFSYAHRYL
uniref:Reverse transcriptase/retrotransposon-derived protein RNase H-like domain-containing protein n=1 Tax=Trichogramma kaykai TaxID=54128 RepID=A0ABD2WHG5_9HYME